MEESHNPYILMAVTESIKLDFKKSNIYKTTTIPA
jgi:hypothetical protein